MSGPMFFLCCPPKRHVTGVCRHMRAVLGQPAQGAEGAGAADAAAAVDVRVWLRLISHQQHGDRPRALLHHPQGAHSCTNYPLFSTFDAPFPRFSTHHLGLPTPRTAACFNLASCTFHPIKFLQLKAGVHWNLCDMQALKCVVLLYYRFESRRACHHVWLPHHTPKTGSAVCRSRK
jgi:hypothetical protein